MSVITQTKEGEVAVMFNNIKMINSTAGLVSKKSIYFKFEYLINNNNYMEEYLLIRFPNFVFEKCNNEWMHTRWTSGKLINSMAFKNCFYK